jgi:hypothetical protein
MHVLKGKVTKLGLEIDVKVMPTSQRVAALKQAGLPFPQPMVIVGLLDTGAGCSCLDRGVVQGLGLDPRGVTRIHTPSTGTNYEERNQYDACLVIGEGYPKPLVLTLPVLGCDFASQGFFALIGRDVLDQCFLMYDGPARTFTLFF